jgi:hypothetical protein
MSLQIIYDVPVVCLWCLWCACDACGVPVVPVVPVGFSVANLIYGPI